MISKKVFAHNKKDFPIEKRLTVCPFLFMKTTEKLACKIEPEKDFICNYNTCQEIPDECPMKDGSITQIFFIE